MAALTHRLGVPVVTSFTDRGLRAGTYLRVPGGAVRPQPMETADALSLLRVIFSDTDVGAAAGGLDLERIIRAIDRAALPDGHSLPLDPDVPPDAYVDAFLATAPTARGWRRCPVPTPPTSRATLRRDVVAAFVTHEGPQPIRAVNPRGVLSPALQRVVRGPPGLDAEE
jgi:hypothetical protein